MGKTIAALALLFFMAARTSAQDSNSRYGGQGYLFIGPIVSNTRYTSDLPVHGGVNAGFGFEAFVYKGLAVGPEFGYAGDDWSFSGNGVGVGSVDASYHFFDKRHRRRVEPFAVGGYSLYFGERTSFQNGYNLGGGMNYWLARHVAVRFEVRDQGNIYHLNGGFTHLVAFRFGMTFR